MKRIAMFLFSVMLIGAVILGKDTGEEGKELGVEVLSQEEIDSLCLGTEFAVFETNVLFEGQELGYDEAQNMLLIPQKLGEEYFHGTVECEEGKLVFLADEFWNDKVGAMSSNHVFRLFRIDDEKHWMYNVYFTGMPIANLSTESVSEEEEHYGTIGVYDQYSDSLRYQEGNCRFRLRGASSRAFPKHSYKVTFTDKHYSLLGMRKDDDWMLHSLYDDEGLIHNKISYDLWQQIAQSNQVANDEGISMEYIEVFVDNEYQGVYGLSERIDKKALGLNEKDILYKGVTINDVGEDDFYLELTEDMAPTFELKYPKTFTMEHWKPLQNWYYGLNEKQITDYEEATKILNMENNIDYQLFLNFISGGDNVRKNTYFWADYQSDGTYQIVKIPWDLNMTWGNGWYPEHKYHFNLYQEKYIDVMWANQQDITYLYELNSDDMNQKMYDRWKELRERIITEENIYSMLDSQFNYIHSSGAYIRDCMFWGNREEYWSDSYIYDYTHKKIEWMDQYMESIK